jgi:hypothetical protein
MPDVAQKSIDANPIKSGTAVVKTTNTRYQDVDPVDNKSPTIAAMEADLTNRFDDPTYYTA